MRTLVLASEPPLPARSGLPLRILHLARALASDADVDVCVAALGDGATPHNDEPFDIRLVPGTWSRPRAIARAAREPWPVAQIASPAMRALARADGWDTVQAHTLAMLAIARDATRPLVFDAPDSMTAVATTMANVDSRRGMRAVWRFEQLKARAAERAAARSAAAVTVPTDDEAALFERLGARVAIVPNGVAIAEVPHSTPARSRTVVFVGYFRWRPNVEAALELIDEVAPRIRSAVPDATVRIVGKDPTGELLARRGSGVEVTGAVDDVVPHLRAARVTVLPIRAGGGTRLKVLEALAAGVPVVATRFAVGGLGLRDGEHVLLAERPADLAAQALRVIDDDALADRLSHAGRSLVEQRFDWSRVARPLVELHHELADRVRPGSRG
jgi:glycosyltransferase involved in cell wall biosynthesis